MAVRILPVEDVKLRITSILDQLLLMISKRVRYV